MSSIGYCPASASRVSRAATSALLAAFSAAGLQFAVPSLSAQIQWANTGTDWGTGSNWIGNSVPTDTSVARLYNTGASGANLYVTPVVTGSYGVLGLDFRMSNATFNSTQSVSINRGAGASQLTIGSSGIITDNASATATIHTDLVIAANQTWNTGSGSTLTIGSAGTLTNSGNFTITKQGSGNLNLNANLNNFTGGINISGGVLQFGTSSTYGGVIQGSGGIWVGSGVLTLRGANTYSGQTNITVGTVRVASIGNTGATSSTLGTNSTIRLGTTTFTGVLEYTGLGESTNRTFDLAGGTGASTTGGATISNLGFGTLTLAGPITSAAASNSTNVLNLLGNVTLATGLNNAGNGGATRLNVVGGSGATTIQAASNFSGGILGNRGGTLVVDYAAGGTLNSANNVTFTNGGNLRLNGISSGTTQTLGNLGFQDGANHVALNNTALTLGTLTRTTGIDSYVLFDLSNSGSLRAVTNGAAGSLVDHVIVGGTASTNLAGFLVRTASGGIDFASAASASATAQDIIPLGSSIASGAFSTFTGTSTGNTVNGRISSNGTTSVGSAQTLGTLRVDTTSAAGGTLQINSGTLTVAKNAIIFDGTGNYTIGGNGTLSAINLYQYSSGTVTLSTAGIGNRIAKFGPGLLINNSNSTFGSSGANSVAVFEGVYRAGTANSLSLGRINLGTGGVLELTSGSGDLTRSLGTTGTNVNFIGDGGFSAFGGNRFVALGGAATPTNLVWSSTGSFLQNGNRLILSSTTSDSTIDFRNSIDFNGVQREVSVGNGSATVDAILSGTLGSATYAGGGLFKSGAGTLALTGTNTYTGLTTISAGQLNLGNGGTTGSIVGNVTNDGILGFNRSDALSYAGVISGSGSVVQLGTGSTILTGAHTYSGGTTVTAGALFVNGSLGTGPVTVSGGTLAGSGTINGATTIQAGGLLAPGNSPGTLTFTNGLTISGTYAWELGALSVDDPGVNFDRIVVTGGAVNVAGASLSLGLGAFAPSADAFWAGNRSWTILDASGATSVAGTFSITNDQSGWSEWGSFSAITTSTGVDLQWTAVIPEPSAFAGLAGLGALGFAALRRRRR